MVTTLSVCRVGKKKWAHRRDKLRRSKSPAGINAPPSLTQAFVWILGSSGTSQCRLLLRGSGAFNVHPFDNLWAIRKLLRLEQSASGRSCHGRFRAFCLPAQLENTEIVLLLCSETRFRVCVLQVKQRAPFSANTVEGLAEIKFLSPQFLLFIIKILFTFPPCSTSRALLMAFPFKGKNYIVL